MHKLRHIACWPLGSARISAALGRPTHSATHQQHHQYHHHHYHYDSSSGVNAANVGCGQWIMDRGVVAHASLHQSNDVDKCGDFRAAIRRDKK
ncbi:unnamed protein product [Ceratitis capitata]|uniref:(Mediterranean fruit fly) hypothetical protein n=1 Tax=Ceratitis capitata TaxID=7213 RepID=A0A811VJZ4_CERCA|nr:unnamed protein product [Ceratitis capitata]